MHINGPHGSLSVLFSLEPAPSLWEAPTGDASPVVAHRTSVTDARPVSQTLDPEWNEEITIKMSQSVSTRGGMGQLCTA